MRIRLLLATLAVAAAPGLAIACSMGKTETTAMSCADGLVYDAETRACVPLASG